MCSHTKSSNVEQTLDELEFERGLWSAACENDLKKCSDLIRKGHDPSKPDSAGFTPLHYAVRSGSKELVECLLKAGSNPNAQTNGGKATALHRSVNKGRPEIVALLLKYKCDPNILDEDGRTALHLCAVETSLPTKEECAKLLYSVTDTQIVDKFGRKAI